MQKCLVFDIFNTSKLSEVMLHIFILINFVKNAADAEMTEHEKNKLLSVSNGNLRVYIEVISVYDSRSRCKEILICLQ